MRSADQSRSMHSIYFQAEDPHISGLSIPLVLQVNLRFIKSGGGVYEKATSSLLCTVCQKSFPWPHSIHISKHSEKTVENRACKFQAEIQPTHGACKAGAVCVPERLYLCEGTVVFKFFSYLLSQAPKLALKPPRPQIKVRPTPGPLTYWQPTNSWLNPLST